MSAHFYPKIESSTAEPVHRQSVMKIEKNLLINVGGQYFSIPKLPLLLHFPTSRLTRLLNATKWIEVQQLCDDVDLDTGSFFFDRDSKIFEKHILTFLFTRKLRITSWEKCVMNLEEEFLYWGVDLNALESCCYDKFMAKKEHLWHENEEILEVMRAMGAWESSEKLPTINENTAWRLTCRQKLWRLMEKPKTSLAARIISSLCIGFILLSTANLLISTLPNLHDQGSAGMGGHGESSNDRQFVPDTHSMNRSFDTSSEDHDQEEMVRESTPAVHGDHLNLSGLRDGDVFETIELACIMWFTLEFIIRLITCPDCKQFFCSILNWIDVVSIVPFYLSLAVFYFIQHSQEDEHLLMSFSKMMQIFRVLRIFRVFKLARHSTGLLALGFTLRKCYPELLLLLLFMSLSVLIFSALIHFIEREDLEGDSTQLHPHQWNHSFSSILSSSWWVIITMTTVGYGDQVPQTWLGKCVGAMCCMCGVLLIALPVPFIVNSFRLFYQHQSHCGLTSQEQHTRVEQAQRLQAAIISTKRQRKFTTPSSFSDIQLPL